MTDKEILEKVYRIGRVMLNWQGKEGSNGHVV